MDQLLNNNINIANEIKENSNIDIFIDSNIENNKKDILIENNKEVLINIIDFSKNDIQLELNIDLKQNSKINFNLISIVNSSYKKKYNVKINHNEISSYSRMKLSGINLGGDLSFVGVANIIKGSKKSDTKVEGKITNLDKNAKSEVSPKLLIAENDVKASHGAALGTIDEKYLFYLISRGLKINEAKSLIIYGTLLPLLKSIYNKDLYNNANNYLQGLAI